MTQEVSDNEYFTGNKSKQLFVHIVQNNVEVTKPIKAKIFSQQIEWNRRVYPIEPKSFLIDSKGVHHQYVEANDMAILRFNKDHEDRCKKCGGKMFVDARNARDLVKRKTIEAIWGIDSTHIILLMIMGIAILIVIGFAFYMFSDNQSLHAKIDSAIATNNIKALIDKGS